MITEKRFKELWDASGLPEYYERMDELRRIGYTFDDRGDMDHYESEALSEWLVDDRSIMDCSYDECVDALPIIKARAKILQQNKLTPRPKLCENKLK